MPFRILALLGLAGTFLCAANSWTAGKASETPHSIYSAAPHDSWNRIFFLLFTRHFSIRLSDEFPEGAPFVLSEFAENPVHGVSTRVFDHYELGDGSLNPLYFPPPDSPEGRRYMFEEPIYSEFTAAIQDALHDATPRSVIARALMQNDLWSAYDRIFEPLFPQDRTPELESRRQLTLNLVGQLIRKLALTQDEIKTLPENYELAEQRSSLPDLFNGNSAWIEIEWFKGRQHDAEAGYRRYTRVFLTPAQEVGDKQKFVNHLPDEPEQAPSRLAGLALVMQMILIDTQGRLIATRVTTDAQVRLFAEPNTGAHGKTEILAYQLSRRLFSSDPASGGLQPETEDTPVYYRGAPDAKFHLTGPAEARTAMLVKLRTQCISCHGAELRQVNTLGIARPPNSQVPPVRVLNPAGFEAAAFSIATQKKSASFQALQKYFESN